MEPARSTGNFNRRITVADSNNIIAILDMNAINSKYQAFEEDYLVEIQAVLEDLKVTVGLLNLAEAPWPDTNALMSESAVMAEIAKIRTQGQKISLGLYTATGNGPWQYESEVVLQNQGGAESHVPILVPFLSSNETLLISGDFKLGVKIEPKWNQPLNANDYLIIKGTWRQVVSFSKKKDDGDIIEDLTSRITSVDLLPGEPLEIAPPRKDKSRRGFIVYNNSSSVAVIAYGATVSPLVYSIRLKPNGGYFEDSTLKPGWQGAYWALGTGLATLNVTELLAN